MEQAVRMIVAFAAAAALILGAAADRQEESADAKLLVRVLDAETVVTLPLDEYLTGVVMQEMPASFEEEALKAQAVAARTFTLRQMKNGGKHEEADVCTDPGCCQCHLREDEGRALYGEGYENARERVRSAVAATDGKVLTFAGEPIEAAYFAGTSGSTESAEAVWGGEVPYLRPVSSPETAQRSEILIPYDEFAALLPESTLSGNPSGWFGAVKKTEGGAVGSMEIGGVVYRGTALRSLFHLPSARFEIEVAEEGIVFLVLGSGHGVGMSQCGADEMARQGSDYREILLHYYSGAALSEWNTE